MKSCTETNELADAISNHLDAYGAKNWAAVQEKFPQISRATFWRAVKRVRGQLCETDPPSLNVGADVQELAQVDQAAVQDGGKTNVMPEQIIRLRALRPQIAALKNSAMDRQGHPKNQMMLYRTIQLEIKALETELAMSVRYLDIAWMERFYKTIIAIVGEEAPEARSKILQRLSEFKPNPASLTPG